MKKTIYANEGSSIFLIALCVSNILATLLVSLVRGLGDFEGMNIMSWVTYALIQIMFIVSAIVYSAVRKLNVPAVTRMNKGLKPLQYVLLPFIAIATILVFLPLANAWAAFLNVINYHGSGVAMPATDKVWVYFLALFIMAVMPAFGEEILMRGFVFHGTSTKSVLFGLLLSSALFSLMHANPVQTVHQFGLGFVLAVVVASSGSIWGAVLIHFFNNFISLTLTTYLPQVDELYVRLGYYNWLTGAGSVVIGFFLLVVLLYLFYRAGEKKQERFKVVSNGIEYESFTIYAQDENKKKSNLFLDTLRFVGSVFTKRGWMAILNALTRSNGIETTGKEQNVLGVWLALGVVGVYWFVAFVQGLI
ncbi:MAG: CPBP family intramembrane metalloprotease [Clostridia bacterium]|nr:CPBP family intramembrane metalloprotease [Clostridia bacterium]